MAYVITDTCTKDEHCIETCPVNCIPPTKDEADFATVPQLYVNPADCIDCGACIPVCPTGSLFVADELPVGLQLAQYISLFVGSQHGCAPSPHNHNARDPI
jgi:NAD-dependent dihydropyrimidine dehydrogenase PreA subunit